MVSKMISKRLPWDDRWSQPTQDQLLKPLKIQQRRNLELLIQQVEKAVGALNSEIVWYGPSWKWTIQYSYNDDKSQPQTLLYLVPNVETPLVCVPLNEGLVERLPLKRLTKFVRDGIRTAKYAVETHWAAWSPNSQKEVGLLTDLLKRKVKIEQSPAESESETEVEATN